MTKIWCLHFLLLLCFITPITFAQENEATKKSAQLEKQQKQNAAIEQQEIMAKEDLPQVGKHVMANMNASSMIMSLLMVLGLIIVSALVLKRFNLTQQNSSQIKVIASLSLGAKERVIVVQIGDQQMVLGVCPQQISLLKNLDTPIENTTASPLALSSNVLSFLQKNSVKADSNNKSTNS